MIVTYKYSLTDIGMNYNGVIQIIEDWTKCIYEEIPHLVGSDYKFVILMHPELRHKLAMNFGADVNTYAFNVVHDPIEIPGADGTFPGVVEEQCTLMHLRIVVTTVLKENELVIANEEFIPLVEGFINRKVEEAYQKGARDGFIRMHPSSELYDENYVFVNLGDKKSIEMFQKLIDKAMRRLKK